MTRQRRARLERRAYPDPQLATAWRRRVAALLALAAALAFAGARWPALIVVLLAIPNLVRHVRRELALGAVIAADHPRWQPSTPSDDARDVYRKH